MAEIPEVYNQPGAGFVTLPAGIKFPPPYKEWQKPENARTYAQAQAHKGNIGILAGNGYIGLDKDNPSAFDGLPLPATTKWETRPGRYGLWFKVSDSIADALQTINKKADLAQIFLYRDGKKCGEIKLQRTYQVIPPSHKFIDPATGDDAPPGKGDKVDYKLLDSSPPATIGLLKLLADLQAIGITFNEKPKVSRLEANTKKLEDMGKKDRQRRIESDESKRRRYAEAALQDEAHVMAGTMPDDRNNQLNKSAFALGQFVSSGDLSEAEVILELSEAAEKTGLDPAEIRKTILSGLQAGRQHPREIPEATHEEEPKDELVSDEIEAKALDILQNGNPVQYIADSCGRMALGAEKAFGKLACCVSVQNVRQSTGAHPKLNGESGGGKTYIAYTFAHHLPPEAVVKGSTSNLAAFYHNDGDRVFRILDDYQSGNDTLDTIIKQTTSVFHQRYAHRSVKKQTPILLYIGSEQTWAITSVDGSQDIQVLNRQIPINVDDSKILTERVNARTIERYGRGEEQFPEDEAVLICREIWRILRADGLIDVRIPFWDRIKWLDTSNRRNPGIFMDLVVAYTAMFRYQREQDAEGYYLATEDDFYAAKDLFTDKDAEELVKRLTRRERDVLEKLVANPAGLTRDDLAEMLGGVAPTRITQIIKGEKGSGGLMQKVAIKETQISEMRRIDDDTKRTVHMTVYSLKEYNPFDGFDGVVILEPRKDGKHDVRKDVRKANDSSKDEIREERKKEKEREKPSLPSVDGSASLKNQKHPYLPYAMAEDTEVHPYDDLTASLSDKEECQLCAKCGEDLTGHGVVEKGGKTYCARPGCGYPARDEAKAT